jgi:type VI protein secretion system component VasF
MTHYIGTIYFLGKYRPLSVEGDNLEEVMIELSARAREAPQEAQERIKDLWLGIDTRYSSQCTQLGTYGASWRKADRSSFPPDAWDTMPPCPNLIYN